MSKRVRLRFEGVLRDAIPEIHREWYATKRTPCPALFHALCLGSTCPSKRAQPLLRPSFASPRDRKTHRDAALSAICSRLRRLDFDHRDRLWSLLCFSIPAVPRARANRALPAPPQRSWFPINDAMGTVQDLAGHVAAAMGLRSSDGAPAELLLTCDGAALLGPTDASILRDGDVLAVRAFPADHGRMAIDQGGSARRHRRQTVAGDVTPRRVAPEAARAVASRSEERRVGKD